jgi:HPt (histidine-containing phosphotransfer) domain-containing protein
LVDPDDRWEPPEEAVMGRLIAGVTAYADRFVPADARGDGDLRRRLRTCVGFGVVYVTQLPTFAVVDSLLGFYEVVRILLAAGALLALAPAVMMRSMAWGIRYVIGILAFTFYAQAYYTGGLYAPAMYWSAALPVVAMMMVSVRAGLAWVCVTVAMTGLLYVAEVRGVALPATMTHGQVRLFTMMCIVMLIVVMTGLALSYESTRTAMLGELDLVNHDMRLVLENVEQGFVTVVRGGIMAGTRSTITDTWFGAPRQHETFGAWIARTDENTGALLNMLLDELFGGEMPSDLCILQLPSAFSVGPRHYALTYRPILEAGSEVVTALVVIVSDTTEQVAAEQAEALQREQLAAFQQVSRDPGWARDFFEDTEHQIAQLERPGDHALRVIHTVKGNAGLFGLEALATVCHEVETSSQDEARDPTPQELAIIRTTWRDTSERIKPLIAEQGAGASIVETDLARLEAAIRAGGSPELLLAMTHGLRCEPGERILDRLAHQATVLGSRVGRCAVQTQVRHGGEGFPRDAWAPVWSAMVHAVRNAVDHGTEPTNERVAQGKPAAMHLLFECARDPEGLRVRVEDDGAGIDWERVREKARARGLPHHSAEALHEALFADGMSTRDEVTELSGRGVGLAALREACANVQATISIRSVRGSGTILEIIAHK